MEIRTIRSPTRAKRRSHEASSYQFNIGQIDRMKSRFGVSPKTAEFYRVTGKLPLRDNSPQYRIRNDDELHERVVIEDNLEEIGNPLTEGSPTLIEATFADNQGTEAQQPRAPKAETREDLTQA